MTIQDFFKHDDGATYHLEFIPENETVFVLKRKQNGEVQTGVFHFQSATMHTKQLLLILKEESSDAYKMVWMSVLPFNDYTMISDPSDVDPEAFYNGEIWSSKKDWIWMLKAFSILLAPRNAAKE